MKHFFPYPQIFILKFTLSNTTTQRCRGRQKDYKAKMHLFDGFIKTVIGGKITNAVQETRTLE
jgi:hypothetical protein